MAYTHIPVMLVETVHYLKCRPGGIYVDCTLGGSGHAQTICKKIIPNGTFIGIDQDVDAIENAKRVLKNFSLDIHLFHDNFINLPTILSKLNIEAVDGILLDLGLSLHQLESSGRGFSFNKDEPLDMRMNIRSITTAEEFVNKMTLDELSGIFKKYGEERWARRIAGAIVMARKDEPVRSSRQLADIICEAVPAKAAFSQKIHPATRTFMALRIAVNKELERLDKFLDHVENMLCSGGRICILSFHSLEDRIVKHKMKALQGGCKCPPDFPKCVCDNEKIFNPLFKKPKQVTQEEVAVNRMARSTRLRAYERV